MNSEAVPFHCLDEIGRIETCHLPIEGEEEGVVLSSVAAGGDETTPSSSPISDYNQLMSGETPDEHINNALIHVNGFLSLSKLLASVKSTRIV